MNIIELATGKAVAADEIAAVDNDGRLVTVHLRRGEQIIGLEYQNAQTAKKEAESILRRWVKANVKEKRESANGD